MGSSGPSNKLGRQDEEAHVGCRGLVRMGRHHCTVFRT